MGTDAQTNRARVSFPSRGAVTSAPIGATLLEALGGLETTFYAPCAGRGTCGKCRVIASGDLAPPTAAERAHLTQEELASGVRLACQARLQGDAIVSPAATGAGAGASTSAGAVAAWGLQRAPLGEPLVQTGVDDVGPAAAGRDGGERRVCGVAVDIGTTTIVAYLADLGSRAMMGAASAPNPQARHGADVVSRLSFAATGAGLETLRKEVVGAVDGLIARLIRESGTRADRVLALVVVGNTVMHHLFLGISPATLGTYPFTPATREHLELAAREAGLLSLNDQARLIMLPVIAGFVGSDALAVALACGMREDAAPTLAVDIGTNGEILLAGRGRILACSAAAGPALEGAGISCGMIAGPGAIDHVSVVDGPAGADLALHVIGAGPAAGICGSGLVSLVAALRRAGVLEASGRFASARSAPLAQRLVAGSDGVRFIVATEPQIALTQRDARQLQLAKAAIRAGADILMRELGVTPDDLESIILAGAFGTYLDPEAAIDIGLLPRSDRARVVSVGNAAGEGAVLALTSKAAYLEALRLAGRVEHIDLGSHEGFQDAFVRATVLDPM